MASVLSGLLLVCTAAYAAVGVLFLAGLLRGGRARPRAAAEAGPPSVSVVIAARNEEDHIGACLDALLRQDYPGRLEIVVADDGSDDGTAAAIAAHPGVVRVDATAGFADHAAKKRPMAAGIARARGDILLTTDADCRVGPGWVQGMVAPFGAGADVVLGFSSLAPGGLSGRLQALDFLALMAAAAGAAGMGWAWAASGQNFGYRRALFERVGGFGPLRARPSGDDVLLLQRLRKAGARAVFVRDSATFVTTVRSESARGFLRQRCRWASNAPAQARLNPAFFGYLCAVAGLAVLGWSLLLPAPTRPLAAVCLLTKGAIDLLVIGAGAAAFGQGRLLWLLPVWEALQAPYIAAVGLLGPFFGYSWKGRRHRSTALFDAGPLRAG